MLGSMPLPSDDTGRRGEPDMPELFSSLYDELYRIACARCSNLRPGHTLHPTAVINEAYLKLERSDFDLRDRKQFLGLAATAMKSVILDYVKTKTAQKRTPPGGKLVQFDEWVQGFERNVGDLVAFDDALTRLREADAAAAKVVELRVFGGMTYAEVASVLEVSQAEVEKMFSFARAWLAKQLP